MTGRVEVSKIHNNFHQHLMDTLTMVGVILGTVVVGYLVTYWIYVGSPLAKATADNVIKTFLSLFKFVMLA